LAAQGLTLHNWRTVKFPAICTTCQYGHAAALRLAVPRYRRPAGACPLLQRIQQRALSLRMLGPLEGALLCGARRCRCARCSQCFPARHQVSPVVPRRHIRPRPLSGRRSTGSIGPKGNRQRSARGAFSTARPGRLCHRLRTLSLMLPSPIGTMTRSSRSPRRPWNSSVAATLRETQPRRRDAQDAVRS
jgi:hypothetical protein